MAYNHARDMDLPGSGGKPLEYYTYPQPKTSEVRIDPFGSDSLKYEITVKGIS